MIIRAITVKSAVAAWRQQLASTALAPSDWNVRWGAWTPNGSSPRAVIVLRVGKVPQFRSSQITEAQNAPNRNSSPLRCSNSRWSSCSAIQVVGLPSTEKTRAMFLKLAVQQSIKLLQKTPEPSEAQRTSTILQLWALCTCLEHFGDNKFISRRFKNGTRWQEKEFWFAIFSVTEWADQQFINLRTVELSL